VIQRFITTMLVVVLTLSGATRALASPRDDKKLALEEEKEARELALSFVKRFHETGDIAPLMDEFFVADFAERLRTEQEDEVPDELPTQYLEREVLRQASPKDLRRFFVTEFNLTSAIVGFVSVRDDERRAKGVADDEGGSTLKNELPAEVVKRLEPDTTQIFDGERGERCAHARAGEATDCEGRIVKAEDCKPPIKNVAQMLKVTSAWEAAAAELRRRIPPLKSIFENEEKSVHDEVGDHYDIYSPQVWAADRTYFGCTPGTRLIYVAAQALLLLQFRFELIRVDGQLKILSVAAVIDGD
jgi:hypothetical protein